VQKNQENQMQQHQIDEAARHLARAARTGARLDGLPQHCRPADLAEGYAVQERVVQLSGRRIAGWKIAATSEAGQRHIGVDGPIAARLLSEHVIGNCLGIPMSSNVMNVAEAEFAFRMDSDLPPRGVPYAVDEVMKAVATLHPAIEIPDSRYTEFSGVGAAQLVADAACALWLATGPATTADWRKVDLVSHEVVAWRNGVEAGRGRGINVLSDPRIAMAWLVNELCAAGQYLRAGDLVTTGACVAPMAVAPGDAMHVDFGLFGTVDVAFV
jgi:2-keto-4-pentenoate hydratase